MGGYVLAVPDPLDQGAHARGEPLGDGVVKRAGELVIVEGRPDGRHLVLEGLRDGVGNRQREALGHSVRAAYLYTGMADVAALTGDMAYIEAIDAIWNDVVTTKLYVTGGIGAAGGHEGFGGHYEPIGKRAKRLLLGSQAMSATLSAASCR